MTLGALRRALLASIFACGFALAATGAAGEGPPDSQLQQDFEPPVQATPLATPLSLQPTPQPTPQPAGSPSGPEKAPVDVVPVIPAPVEDSLNAPAIPQPVIVSSSFAVYYSTSASFPENVDSNSPAFWHHGVLMVFNSTSSGVFRSSGYSADTLGDAVEVSLPRPERPGPVWFESVWFDASDGTLYGWYHFEPADLPCYTAAVIGAAVSHDDGLTWEDRGFVLQNAAPPDCDYDNGYVSGGNGDFSVVVDPAGEYFYFLFSNYGGPIKSQGIALARSSFAERGQPGTVWKYFNGAWDQPGMDGDSTPIFGTETGWAGPYIDAYWGPSVHWNTYLQTYVAVLNHSVGADYNQEGIYLTFSRDLIQWSQPQQVLNGGDWYPQFLGLGEGETDSVAGQNLRLYVHGSSVYEVVLTQTPVSAGSVSGNEKAPE